MSNGLSGLLERALFDDVLRAQVLQDAEAVMNQFALSDHEKVLLRRRISKPQHRLEPNAIVADKSGMALHFRSQPKPAELSTLAEALDRITPATDVTFDVKPNVVLPPPPTTLPQLTTAPPTPTPPPTPPPTPTPGPRGELDALVPAHSSDEVLARASVRELVDEIKTRRGDVSLHRLVDLAILLERV